MPKRKCSFTEELLKSFPAFRPGRDKWEALCTVCKAGTYVSVSNGGARDLKIHLDTEKHKTAVRGEDLIPHANASDRDAGPRWMLSSLELLLTVGRLSQCLQMSNCEQTQSCTTWDPLTSSSHPFLDVKTEIHAMVRAHSAAGC
ncbi:unnamed protein product [Pleuronectes platessa]|uniref:Uncharacterized protein n=1 Tax=Pleuronectes platessa TaxID=8262 RepID=A0A9N7UDT5_PLEPL|nr:unnamed protein product [Pleuronectes platessa]